MIKTIRFDDGSVTRIEVPEGASDEDINAFVSSNQEAIKAKAKAPVQQSETYNYQDKDAGNFGNSLLSGATFNLADEAMGGVAATYAKIHDMITGNKSGITYESARDSIRDDQEAFAERNPGLNLTGEIVGSLTTGGLGGAKFLGSQTLKQAPKFAQMAAVPALAGTEGALFGFGSGEGYEDSFKEAGQQGLISAVAGPILNKAGTMVGNKIFKKEANEAVEALTPTRTLDDLIDDSKSFYKAAEDAGVVVKGESYKPFKENLIKFLDSEAIDGQTYPKIGKALRRIAKLENPTYKDIEGVKRLMKQAKLSADPNDRRVAGIINTEVDNFIDALSPTDLLGGKIDDLTNNLKNAKKLWSQKAQAETIDDIEERALRSESYIDADDLDKAVRSKARPILDNERKKLGLDEEVTISLQKMIDGTPGKNLARSLAGITPGSHTQRGLLPTLGAAGAGMAITGSPVGLLLGVVPGITGSIARKIANKMTKKEISDLKYAIVNKGQLNSKKWIDALMEKYKPLIGGATSSIAASGDNINTSLQDISR